MKDSQGEPFAFDAASLQAIGDDTAAITDLDVRTAELADIVATAGLIPQPQATSDALRLMAKTRPGRTGRGWTVS